jgi:hypothetical protein
MDTASKKELGNREIPPEDEMAAVLDLVQRVVMPQVDGGTVLLGDFRPKTTVQ